MFENLGERLQNAVHKMKGYGKIIEENINVNLIISGYYEIKNEFQEAETLKLDAQKLYADNERKLLNIEQEIENIF